MQEESIVRDIEISDGRQVHKASYYVENGMLHARIGGKMISLGTGAETARVVERVGSPALKMVWDPGNAFMAGERPFPSGYEAVAPHLAHVHIKDARVTEEGKLYWTVVGEGEIDYAGHFLALAKAGYDGVLALETHYRTPDGDAEKASRECLDGMKRLIAEATTKAANA